LPRAAMVDVALPAWAMVSASQSRACASDVSSLWWSRSDDWMSKAPEDTTVMGAAFVDVGGDGLLAVVPPDTADSPTGVLRWLPGLKVLQDYQSEWLRQDVVAGLVLTAVLVPVGMAYAEAAGLPPITGLYATLVPLTAYALFGPSRILVLGPDSSLAGIIAAVVLPLAAGDPGRGVALAGMLSIITGLICVAAGIFKLGFITDLLSKPVRYGYVNGIALTVIVGQLPKLFGFSIDATGLIPEARAFVSGVRDGQTNVTALLIGLASLVIIIGCKRVLPKVPGVLVAVVGATAAVGVFNLAERTSLSVVGVLPQGLPPFAIPSVTAADVGPLVVGAVGIAIVAFADTSVLSRTFALRGGYEVDPDQELVALGAANIASGFFQGFAISSSSSRTPVAAEAGAKTQVTGLVGAGAIVVLLVAFPNLVKNLPSATLAAVVIAAAFSLVEIAGVRSLYHLRRSEFVLSIVCFLGVAVAGVIPGVFIAVGLALFSFIKRAWRPYDAVLGRIDGQDGFHDVSRHPEAQRLPGLVLFRWDAPLFFANAGIFQDHIEHAIRQSPSPVLWVVVTAEPITDIDTTAADTVRELLDDLRGAGIRLCFAEVKGPVKDQLKRYELFAEIGPEFFFPTIDSAVRRYIAETRVEWADLEDAHGPESTSR
jgi:high affinity sulfate transporter 1